MYKTHILLPSEGITDILPDILHQINSYKDRLVHSIGRLGQTDNAMKELDGTARFEMMLTYYRKWEKQMEETQKNLTVTITLQNTLLKDTLRAATEKIKEYFEKQKKSLEHPSDMLQNDNVGETYDERETAAEEAAAKMNVGALLSRTFTNNRIFWEWLYANAPVESTPIDEQLSYNKEDVINVYNWMRASDSKIKFGAFLREYGAPERPYAQEFYYIHLFHNWPWIYGYTKGPLKWPGPWRKGQNFPDKYEDNEEEDIFKNYKSKGLSKRCEDFIAVLTS